MTLKRCFAASILWQDVSRCCRMPRPPGYRTYLAIGSSTFNQPLTQEQNMATNIRNVTVLGTGVLGSQIAYQTAYSGFEVVAYDINDQILDTAKRRFEELAARYEREVEGARGGRAQAALARIKYSSSAAEAVRDADLVIEAVPEIPAV